MREKDFSTAAKAASTVAGPKQPQWLKCLDCSYVWIGIFVPMELAKYARLMRRAFCPKCGATAQKITLAKQEAGALLEPAPHRSVFDGPILEGIRKRALSRRGRKTAPISDFNHLWTIVEFCVYYHREEKPGVTP